MALQLRRGLKANLPAKAAAGEPLIATDTRELWIGQGLLGTDGDVYKVSDVIISDVEPAIAGNSGKVWVNTTTNNLYRLDTGGGVWQVCGGITMLTDVALGGATPVDTAVPTQKAVKTYVDTAIAGLVIPTEWPDSVLSYLSDPSALTPVNGARYLVKPTAIGAWAGFDNAVATYVLATTSWTFQAPTTGTFISVDDDTTAIYYYGGSGWVKKSFEVNTAGTGIDITNGVVSVRSDIVAADGSGGLTFVGGVLAVGTIDGGTF